ncbi:hypothetical protein C5C44_16360 [Rathayibacter sp. AY1F6]|uniref:hypothetical protein n=1 Tax=unclassified Rathayibacter TaxID=2609250 RepID=UPI000CE8FE3F|nr:MULTISPECIES: hypothetical protein [unclassified Rathayibacter]PPG99842.1 hypothetical protein C5C32_10350 [Rathayibacter sp. AY1G9]PPG99892.1 hypothetical protein C5C44_16360 [Rathayibacter sp. AY1F6]
MTSRNLLLRDAFAWELFPWLSLVLLLAVVAIPAIRLRDRDRRRDAQLVLNARRGSVTTSVVMGVIGACASTGVGVLIMAIGILEGWGFFLLAAGALVQPAITAWLVRAPVHPEPPSSRTIDGEDRT